PMPEMLDWQRGDPRQVLQRAVQELTAGRLVVFPTDTGYNVAASLVHPEALTALAQIGRTENAVLAVRDLADAVRWAPGMSVTARRLGRRTWPGPITLMIDIPSSDSGATALAGVEGTVCLRVPGHEAPLGALEQLSG